MDPWYTFLGKPSMVHLLDVYPNLFDLCSKVLTISFRKSFLSVAVDIFGINLVDVGIIVIVVDVDVIVVVFIVVVIFSVDEVIISKNKS